MISVFISQRILTLVVCAGGHRSEAIDFNRHEFTMYLCESVKGLNPGVISKVG